MLEYVEEYLEDCRLKNLSPNTMRGYRDSLEKFSDFCDDLEPHQITRRIIKSYLHSVMETGATPHAVNWYHRNIRAFFNHLIAEEVLDKSPFHNTPMQKTQTKIVPEITPETFKCFVSGFDLSCYSGQRDYMLAVLLYDTGIRLGEAVSLKMGTVLLKEQTIIVTGKGDKQRVVPFGANIRRRLAKCLREREQYLVSAKRICGEVNGRETHIKSGSARHMGSAQSVQPGILCACLREGFVL